MLMHDMDPVQQRRMYRAFTAITRLLKEELDIDELIALGDNLKSLRELAHKLVGKPPKYPSVVFFSCCWNANGVIGCTLLGVEELEE